MTLRDLDCDPVPHDFVQVDHAAKDDTTQCPAQAWSLHALCSCRYGHAYPPELVSVVTLRDLDCDPVPHDLVHADQALNAETTQCPAQAWSLHARLSSR